MNGSAVRPQIAILPIALIDEPALPSRSTMDEQKMDELVASMRAIGFISTIAVVRVGDRFEVVAGHRRRIAAGLAGVAAVPCLVYPSKDEAVEAIQHAENKHREDLNPADEAIWFYELLERHPDEGTDGVAARVGEGRGYVEGRIALLQGDELIFDALKADRIRVGVAQQLNRCTQQLHRRMLLDLAIRNGATVAMVSGWIAEWKTLHEPATRNLPQDGPPAPSAPLNIPDYFTCHLCESKEHHESMRPVQMHDYCIRAVLEPALDQWRHKRDYVAWPRTLEDARELVSELLDRFPALVPEDSASA